MEYLFVIAPALVLAALIIARAMRELSRAQGGDTEKETLLGVVRPPEDGR